MNWSKISYLLTTAVLLGSLCSCSIQQRVKRADKKFAIGEYYEAGRLYKNCYGQIPAKKERSLKAKVAFQQGECYRILNNPRAENMYRQAIKYKYADTDDIVYLRLAQAQQYQGKYKDAEKNYRLYLERHGDSYVAQAGVYACEHAAEWKKQKSKYKVTLAKDFAAKRASADCCPAFIGENADALMFTSNRKVSRRGEKKGLDRPSSVTGQAVFSLFTTRKDANGRWQEIVPVQSIFEGEQEEEKEAANDSTDTGNKAGKTEVGACCFTADGKTMYFTYSRPVNGQDLGAKIFRSDRTGGEWGEPKEVKLFADSSITVGHPAISAKGDTIYFVSDAPGGYGGKDIWMAENIDDKWTAPVNLGPQINTSNDEMYPVIRKDGTLYFSSTGHPGFGGLDIFRAIPTGKDTMIALADTLEPQKMKIVVVENMGMPFNSSADDFGVTFEGDKQNGFFSSNRGQKKGDDKIYRFVLPEIILSVEGKVTDNNGEPLAGGVLRMVGNDGTNQKLQIRKDGTYRLKLQPNVKYIMLAASRGYLNQKQTLETGDAAESKVYTQDFSLAPVSKPITMNNVLYEFGKWELTESSSGELLGLVKMMQDNPYITIELGAHTDMVGDSVSNRTLSEKRAQACVDFLIKHGIDKERLTPVGYGESKPKAADKGLHDKHKFIPIDQVLDEEFILTLTPEQQEICNQINRRTEFRVLKTTYKLY